MKYGSILWLEDDNLYLQNVRLRTMWHTIYAAKFEQTTIHQHAKWWNHKIQLFTRFEHLYSLKIINTCISKINNMRRGIKRWLSPYLEQGVIESIYGAGGGLSPKDGAGDVN
jgi:hypothetical protein